MRGNLNVIGGIAGLSLLIVLAFFFPHTISDSNDFLKSFVGEQLLGALGVILAINLASLAQLHLGLNRLEERRGQPFLSGARKEIRSAARWMVGLFVAAVVVVVVKPLLVADERVEAFANGAAIFVLGFYILIMADIVDAVFDMEPDIDEPERPIE